MRIPLAETLLAWYRREGRDLPWRRCPTPYRVWVSEIMLQQTTVATAAPYFERFIERFPTVRELAAAKEREILALWSGLGYYHRARNMLKAARTIVSRHGSRIPSDLESLRALPGVGAYTAGAIRSIGHNLPAAALDANILRVVARLGAIEGETSRSATRRSIETLAIRLIPPGAASELNQALMDLGATICTARAPACARCPAAANCRARRTDLVSRIPPAPTAVEPVRVELAGLSVRRGASVLLVERAEGRLMKGLWEFPLLPAATREEADSQAAMLGARLIRRLGLVRHAITRHRIEITVYEARLMRRSLAVLRPGVAGSAASPEARAATRLATPLGADGRPDARWVRLDTIATNRSGALALTGSARKISRLLIHDAAHPALPGFTRAG